VSTRLLAISTFTALMTQAAGCDSRNTTLRWTEDAALPDGRMITLTRYQEFKVLPELGQPRGPTYHWFSLRHPDLKEDIYWEDSGDLGIVAIWIREGRVYLLTKPYYEKSKEHYGCPDPPYLLFRFENAKWSSIPIEDIGVAVVQSNMTYGADVEVRELIKQSHFRLSRSQSVLDRNYRPWVMDFAHAPKQSFGDANCRKISNDLVKPPVWLED
jgi:hypothetical protein